jgi:hypothetical protein
MLRMENLERDIVEEKTLPERVGILASKRYATTAPGTVLKEVRVAFCDSCGRRLNGNDATVLCCVCKKKLCPSPCAIVFEGKHYCEDDLQRVLPLSRLQWKILHGLISELPLDEVRDLARSRKQAFRSALNELRVNSYVERRGVSLFASHELLDRGIMAWKTYQRAFAEGDVSHFMDEVRARLEEVSEDGAKRPCGKRR